MEDHLAVQLLLDKIQSLDSADPNIDVRARALPRGVEVTAENRLTGEEITLKYEGSRTTILRKPNGEYRQWAAAPPIASIARADPKHMARQITRALSDVERDEGVGFYSTNPATGRIENLQSPKLKMRDGKIRTIDLEGITQGPVPVEFVGSIDAPDVGGINVYSTHPSEKNKHIRIYQYVYDYQDGRQAAEAADFVSQGRNLLVCETRARDDPLPTGECKLVANALSGEPMVIEGVFEPLTDLVFNVKTPFGDQAIDLGRAPESLLRARGRRGW